MLPAYRGRRVATGLCRQLVASVPGAAVFATTRTDNLAMQHVLGVAALTAVDSSASAPIAYSGDRLDRLVNYAREQAWNSAHSR